MGRAAAARLLTEVSCARRSTRSVGSIAFAVWFSSAGCVRPCDARWFSAMTCLDLRRGWIGVCRARRRRRGRRRDSNEWLTDADHRDQFVVRHGEETEVFWSMGMQVTNPILSYGGEREKKTGLNWCVAVACVSLCAAPGSTSRAAVACRAPPLLLPCCVPPSARPAAAAAAPLAPAAATPPPHIALLYVEQCPRSGFCSSARRHKNSVRLWEGDRRFYSGGRL